MDFFGANLKVNNLGRYCANAETTNGCTAIVDGHDTSQPVLLYENIGKLRKVGDAKDAPLTTVHLKVEVAPDENDVKKYKANNGEGINGFGRNDAFGEINLGGRPQDMTHRNGVPVDDPNAFADCMNE